MNGSTRRIVVGVDGSGSSRAALRWAIEQAKLTGASVDALMAWQYPTAVVDRLSGPEADFERVTTDALAEVLKQEADPQPGVQVRPVVAEGHPADALVRASGDADLLVVGGRGLGGFVSAVVGSVSLQCVLHARCPVLVMRDGHEGQAPQD
jgi:nucleotide-binding universal stress UspA family protein